MIYLYWALPALAVASAIGLGMTGAVGGSLVGAGLALLVGLTAAPLPFGFHAASEATLRGAWLAWTLVPYIFGGLFFWEVVGGRKIEAGAAAPTQQQRRDRVFFACLLVGPFMESATGFGVGMFGTIAMVRAVGASPLQAIVLGLFSQTLIPWGGLGSGTMFAAEIARQSPTTLALICAVLAIPVMAGWLLLFWRFAAAFGFEGARRQHVTEAGWLLLAMALLVPASWRLGPEVACLASFGPVIAARFWIDNRSNHAGLRAALHGVAPYVALVLVLTIPRAIPPVGSALADALAIRPFTDGPVWSPLLHPGSWLMVVGLWFAATSGRMSQTGRFLARSWSGGKNAIYAIVVFAIMAEILTRSGIASQLAEGIGDALGRQAVLSVPLLAGLFGFLTNSSNATNSLFMQSQVVLAGAAGVSVPWLAAIQHLAGASMTMLSPVRMAMASALVGASQLEREAYAQAWPLALAPMLVLIAAAAMLLA